MCYYVPKYHDKHLSTLEMHYLNMSLIPKSMHLTYICVFMLLFNESANNREENKNVYWNI